MKWAVVENRLRFKFTSRFQRGWDRGLAPSTLAHSLARELDWKSVNLTPTFFVPNHAIFRGCESHIGGTTQTSQCRRLFTDATSSVDSPVRTCDVLRRASRAENRVLVYAPCLVSIVANPVFVSQHTTRPCRARATPLETYL